MIAFLVPLAAILISCRPRGVVARRRVERVGQPQPAVRPADLEGRAADTDAFARVINDVLGTKLEVISGYPGGNDITLAMGRGEVQGRCGWSWSSIKSLHSDWVENENINLLMQLSLAKHSDLADVPLIMDLVEDEEDRQILELVFARQVMGRARSSQTVRRRRRPLRSVPAHAQ